MTSQRQDEKLDFFKTGTSETEGALPDLERQYYKQITGFSGNEIHQLKQKWLASLGQTGTNITDEWFKYLRLQGYTGALADMEKAYYAANS